MVLFRYNYAVALPGSILSILCLIICTHKMCKFLVVVELMVEGRLRLIGLKWDSFRRLQTEPPLPPRPAPGSGSDIHIHWLTTNHKGISTV